MLVERSPISLVLRRHGNHARVSGYDRISEHIPGHVIRQMEQLSLVDRGLVKGCRRLIHNSGSQWYGARALATEARVGLRWLRRSGQIFHFLYGENSYRYTGKLKALRDNKIVCTYHTPPERFAEVVQDRAHLALVDRVIVVSMASFDTFAELLGPDRVRFVPHGVDTDFFQPPTAMAERHEDFHCLFVGSHLRDFTLLANLIRKSQGRRPKISFEVITLSKDFHYFEGLTNVTLREGVSDAELRSAYQRADVLLMPLTDATANNSLLEAMACGLPIVVTDLPGARDYVDSDCAVFTPLGDTGAMETAITDLQRGETRRQAMSMHCRERALEYRFERVAAQTCAVYDELMNERKAG